MPLRQLFSTIENQSDYMFFYVDSDINGIDVSVKVNDTPVETVLDLALAETDLVYEIKDRYITILSKKDEGGGNSAQETARQRDIVVSGQCLNKNRHPLPGVVVMVKGSDTGAVTDSEGKYTIKVPSSTAVLVFSFLGYDAQEIPVGTRSQIDVTMIEIAQQLDDVVVVGYGTQVKGKLTGSVSDLKGEKLTTAPIANVTHALAGQMPGMIVKEQGGQPGSDMASINIRGFGSALVIVDGVESSFTNLDPSQIESISILKDGAASIYGARAGNGVILVTTKRGNTSKPTITINSSYTLQTVTRMLEPASSGQWAELEREIHLMQGLPESTAPWTTEDIAKFYAGDDPGYPNSDWFDFVLRKTAPMQNHNVSIRGGSDAIKYYGFVGYTDQETIIRHKGGNFRRYNIQSNIDAAVTKNLKLSLDLSLIYENHLFAKRGVGNGGYFWNDLYGSRPWYPTTLPDPTKIAYSGIDVGSPYAMSNMDIAGYNKTQNRNLRGGISLEYDFSRFVKGLKAKAYVNYRDEESYYKGFSRPTSTYTYNNATDQYTKVGDYKTQADLSESVTRSNVLTQQYSISYDNVFGDHRISAIALFEALEYKSNWFSAYRGKFLTPSIEQMFAGSSEGKDNGGSASEMGRMSWVGRLNYSYKDKYLLEAILRADASSRFAPGYRWGYFPSVSVGWVISREGFMENATWLELLKLRASYGASGNDGTANFAYLAGYAIEASNTYILGDNPQKLLYATGLANPLLSWEKMGIYNVGVDFTLNERKLYGSAEFFYRNRTGIPASRMTSLPSTFGANLPVENLNHISDRGFEVQLGTVQTLGPVTLDISGNISWSRAKWEHYEEPAYTDPDQRRLSRVTGTWTDNTIGYRSAGLFTSMEEIENYNVDYTPLLAAGNSVLRPGDVKLIDTNKDGVLDWKDQEFLGASTMPHWMYGLNLGVKWRNFDLSALFQGAFGYMTNVSGVAYSGAFKTKQQYDLRWSEKNNDAHALLPRLSGAATNALTSDFFYKKTAYLRLKNLSIGYEIPRRILAKAGISQLRIYVAGTNLFTASNLNKYGIDPEAPWLFSYYPQQRTYSIGVNLSF